MSDHNATNSLSDPIDLMFEKRRRVLNDAYHVFLCVRAICPAHAHILCNDYSMHSCEHTCPAVMCTLRAMHGPATLVGCQFHHTTHKQVIGLDVQTRARPKHTQQRTMNAHDEKHI